jgi:outer membrane protein
MMHLSVLRALPRRVLGVPVLLLWGALACGFSPAAHAQWTPPQSVAALRPLFERALQFDAEFAAARATHDAEVQGTRLAAAAFRPTLTVTASADQSWTRREDLASGQALSRDYAPLGWGLRLAQPLYNQDRQGYRTENEIRAVRATSVLAQARQDLLLRVAQATFNYLLAQDQLVLARAQADAVAAQLTQVEAMLPSRSATRTDAADARARYEVARAQTGLAESQLQVRRLELARLIGTPVPADLVPVKSIPDLALPQPQDAQAWIEAARQRSPKVAALEWNVKLAEAGIVRAKAAMSPSLSLVASAQRNLAPNYFTSSERNNSVGLQFSMTLYDGGLTSAQVDQAGFQRERARSELEAARQELGVLAGQAYWGVVNGAQQVRAMEEAVKAAELTVEGTRLGIQANIKTYADELNAVQQLFAARRDLQRERYAFLFSGIQLMTLGADELSATVF